jgi:hypothetical protein
MPAGTVTNNQRWDEQYAQLQALLARGGTYPRQTHGRLGAWVATQRSRYRRGALAEDRIKRLEALPEWAWGVRAGHWDHRYNELREHLDRHGTYPARQTVLARWVTEQSVMFKRGSMPAHRRELLEALPGWVWRSREDRWDESFQQLNDRLAGGEANPHHESTLGRWMTHQRRLYGRGALSAERIDKLERLPGWTWDSRADRWDEQYENLRQLLAGGGAYPAEGAGLGGWINNQRSLRRRGALPADRVEKLEALPHWRWNFHADRWDEFYEELRQHLDAGGSYPMQGRGVGSWITRQRFEYHRGALTPERIKLLEALPGWKWRMLRRRR